MNTFLRRGTRFSTPSASRCLQLSFRRATETVCGAFLCVWAALAAGCGTISKIPDLPPIEYQVGHPADATYAHLLGHATSTWRRPNLTWSEDPIAVIAENRVNANTRAIMARRTPIDLNLPPFIEVTVTEISPESCRVRIRNLPNGLNDSTTYYAGVERWLSALGKSTKLASVEPTAGAPSGEFRSVKSPDSASIRGGAANVVRYFSQDEAHVGIREVDGQPTPIGNQTLHLSPGEHSISVIVVGRHFLGRDSIHLDLRPTRKYHVTAVVRDTWAELTLWDDTDSSGRVLVETWRITGQFEVGS
jgi:hypothetical protein